MELQQILKNSIKTITIYCRIHSLILLENNRLLYLKQYSYERCYHCSLCKLLSYTTEEKHYTVRILIYMFVSYSNKLHL